MILFWISLFGLLALALLFIFLPLGSQLNTPRDRGVMVGVTLLTVLLSLGLYFKQGDSGGLKQSIALEQRAIHLKALLDAMGHDPQKAIVMMKNYLKNKPDDQHGWYLLGKLYESVGDKKRARDAFAKGG